MGCPNFVFYGSADLNMWATVGYGPIQVNQNATASAIVHNNGFQEGTGSVTFYWQQLGMGAPIVQLPPAPASLNPVQVNGGFIPAGGTSLQTSMIWTPTQAIVGTTNPAKGYLYATVSTDAIAGSCPANNPSPSPNPSYPGYTACVLQQVRNPPLGMAMSALEAERVATPDDSRILLGFVVGAARGHARLSVRSVEAPGLASVETQVSVVDRRGEVFAAGVIAASDELARVHDLEPRSGKLDLELGHARQGILSASFGRERARSLVQVRLELLDRNHEVVHVGGFAIGLQNNAADPIWLY